MATLKQFQPTDYEILLNHKKIETAGGALMGNGSKLEPDTVNRTIFIGLGGTGVKTLNKIKSALKKRMAANWIKYVAFLAIDSDWTELDRAGELSEAEKLMFTRNGINERFSNRNSYPHAAHQFMPDGNPNKGDAVVMGDMGQAGANRARLVGKAKIHDKAAGDTMGVDEEIVNRLMQLTNHTNMNAMVGTIGAYEVYVIGSVSGGTCSGSFTDMPSLVRKALEPLGTNSVYVHAILYLPDTLIGLDPGAANELQANGYASLKELNYYQGMLMRPGYSESFPYSNQAQKKLKVKDEYFSLPYLIGSLAGGADPNASAIARETIAEFLISLVAKIQPTDGGGMHLTASFRSNNNPTKWSTFRHTTVHPNGRLEEAAGEHHIFPLSFTSIGFSRANAPEKLVRAYQVNVACERAGLHTITAEERKAKAASGATFLPFRDAEDFFDAADAENRIKKMLAPLESLLKDLHSGHFTLATQPGFQNMTFGMAKTCHPNQIEQLAQKALEEQAGVEASAEIKKDIAEAFKMFREEVISFVKEFGPLAFVNLYKGNILPQKDGSAVRGIGERLLLLINGKKFDGKAYPWVSVAAAESERTTARKSVDTTADSAINRGLNAIDGRLDKIRDAWFNTTNNWVAARINEQRRDLALGDTGLYATEVLAPAALICEQLQTFGNLLDALSGVYAKHGSKMQNFNAFAGATDSGTDINIAAINGSAYSWLKKKADDAIKAVQGKTFRDAVIDHFFGADDNGAPNWDQWLAVPDEMYTTKGQTIILQGEDVAIPARQLFDQLVADQLAAPVTATVQELFEELKKTSGQSYDATAGQIIAQLGSESKPLCRVENGRASFRYILYPATLRQGPEGLAIEAALRNEATRQFPGIQCYATADADGILFYQQAGNFAVHQLSDVQQWENEYNVRLGQLNNLLHGKSPATFEDGSTGVLYYREDMPWMNYPDLIGRPMPKSTVSLSMLCREDLQRLEVRKNVAEAKKLGVLYAQQDMLGKWYVYRAYCDPSIDWQFSISGLRADRVTGMYPLGKDLAAAVAIQSGTTLDNISRAVSLLYAGVYSDGYASEDEAWEKAEMILRTHVPMYMEVVHTLDKFRVWAEQILTINEFIRQQLRPAMMEFLIKNTIIYRTPNGEWMVKNPDGTEDLLANLSEMMLQFSMDGAAQMLANNMLGYYLFDKLDARYPGEKLQELCRFVPTYMQRYQANLAFIQPQLMEGKAHVEAIVAEKAVHIQQGARPVIAMHQIRQDPTPMYQSYLRGILPLNEDEIREVELFYSRVRPESALVAQLFM